MASKKEYVQSLATRVTIKEVRPSKLKELFIFPLPPLEVQKQLVTEMEEQEKIIEANKKLVGIME